MAHILPAGCTARCPRSEQVPCPQKQRAQGGCSGLALSPALQLPPQPLIRDAAELSTSPGLHGFTALQKHINPRTSLFEQVSQLYCKLWYNVCHAAQRCCTQRAQDLTDLRAKLLLSMTAQRKQSRELNPQTALCFYGMENFFLSTVWQLIQPSCTLKVHWQKDNCLLAPYNSCCSRLVWGQSGYRIQCTQSCKYFVCTGCFNLNLHSDIYFSSELCPTSLASSAVILSYWKAADSRTLYTIYYVTIWFLHTHFYCAMLRHILTNVIFCSEG